MVIIDFEFDTEYGVFKGALCFSDDYPIPDQTELDVLKQQRLNDFLALFTTPDIGT